MAHRKTPSFMFQQSTADKENTDYSLDISASHLPAGSKSSLSSSSVLWTRGQSPVSALLYCAACEKDTRTLVVYEARPQGLQLLCCWSGEGSQVLAVHKCVRCKRVIARLPR